MPADAPVTTATFPLHFSMTAIFIPGFEFDVFVQILLQYWYEYESLINWRALYLLIKFNYINYDARTS